MENETESSDWYVMRFNFELIQQQVFVQHFGRACQLESVGNPYRLGSDHLANDHGVDLSVTWEDLGKSGPIAEGYQ